MSFVKGLQCRECGQEYPERPFTIIATLENFDRLFQELNPTTTAKAAAS